MLKSSERVPCVCSMRAKCNRMALLRRGNQIAKETLLEADGDLSQTTQRVTGRKICERPQTGISEGTEMPRAENNTTKHSLLNPSPCCLSTTPKPHYTMDTTARCQSFADKGGHRRAQYRTTNSLWRLFDDETLHEWLLASVLTLWRQSVLTLRHQPVQALWRQH